MDYTITLTDTEKKSMEYIAVDVDAWITGLTRHQGGTRTDTPKITIDHKHNNIAKISPIADWDNEMVWKYIKDNNVPYNTF